MTDVQTVTMIAKELPPRHCLVLGGAVNDFPLVVKVREVQAKTMGETRLFFASEARRPEKQIANVVPQRMGAHLEVS